MGLLGGGGGGAAFTSKWIVAALAIMFLVPTTMVLFVPAHLSESEYAEQIAELESDYYATTGTYTTSNMALWALSGIYTAYGEDSQGNASLQYGYDEVSGWLYGMKVVSNSPGQYTGTDDAFTVTQGSDGLFYYSAVSSTSHSDVAVNDLYTRVVMDANHVSDRFFSTSTKVTTDTGYYYQFSGYRYVWQPLEDFYIDDDGNTRQLGRDSAALSLIWYQYSTLSGIAGQLAISGQDRSVSYLSASDILEAFNGDTLSSSFNLVFGNLKMHLVIAIDPVKYAGGLSVTDCYNAGYWSVMVYSDAISDSAVTGTYSFSIDNIFTTLISIFTFDLADQYDIDGWMATLVSVLVSLPFYAVLIGLAIENYYLWILVALLAAVQTASSWWPFW